MTIFSIKDPTLGNVITDEASIKKEGIMFLKDLLDPLDVKERSEEKTSSLSEAFPKVVTNQENSDLMKLFSLEEIQKVVQTFPPDKAPRQDGFMTLFYQKYWDVIGWDLLLALEESRTNRAMLSNFNSKNIAIIPKIGDPQTFSDFRPISLCNTICKIFTKVI